MRLETALGATVIKFAHPITRIGGSSNITWDLKETLRGIFTKKSAGLDQAHNPASISCSGFRRW